MGPAVVGTLLITGAASLMAIPLGILGGIYLNEYGGKQPARAVRSASSSEVMTGVPSIVMGLFIYTSGRAATRRSSNGFAGALALACLMLPIVIRTTDADAHARARASSARAATRSGAARRGRSAPSCCRTPRAGHRERRAARRRPRRGRDRAAALHHRHRHARPTPSLFNGPNTALSVQIFSNATSPFTAAQDRAWGAALTLIADRVHHHHRWPGS